MSRKQSKIEYLNKRCKDLEDEVEKLKNTKDVDYFYEEWNNTKNFKEENEIIAEIKDNQEAIDEIIKTSKYALYLARHIKFDRKIFMDMCLMKTPGNKNIDIFHAKTLCDNVIKMQNLDNEFYTEYFEKSLEVKYCTWFDIYFADKGLLPWKKMEFLANNNLIILKDHHFMMYPRLLNTQMKIIKKHCL